MSDRPIYAPEALNRLERLGDKAISSFANEIPRNILKGALNILPPLAGFRPGTTIAIQRQLHVLAQRIATHATRRGFSQSKEETVLYFLWRAWAQSKLAEPNVVRELFAKFDDEGTNVSEGTTHQHRMTAAVRTLVEAGTCSRELLETFVAYSPFDDISAFSTLVGRAPTAAEIKRTSALNELPARLHQDELRLQQLETKLDTVEQRLQAIEVAISEVQRTLVTLQAGSNSNASSITNVGQVVSDIRESLLALEESSRMERAAVQTGLLALRTDVTAVQTETMTAKERVSRVEALASFCLERVFVAGIAVIFRRRERGVKVGCSVLGGKCWRFGGGERPDRRAGSTGSRD